MASRRTFALLLQKGISRYNAGNFAAALDFFRRALRINNQSADTFIYIAHAHHSLGHTAEAIESLYQAVQKHPDCFQAYADLGKFLAEQRRFPEAEKACRSAIRLQPKSVEMHMELARSYGVQRKTEKAKTTYQKILRLDSTHFSAYLELGSLLRRDKRIVEAQKVILKAIQIKPLSSEARIELARVYHAVGKVEKAKRTIKDAVERQQVNMALALADKGNSGTSLTIVRRILTDNPRCSAAHIALGDILRTQKRIEDSKKAYARALILDPHSVEVHSKLLDLYFQSNEFKGVVRQYLHLIQLQPDNPENHASLARLLFASRRLRKAEKVIKNALATLKSITPIIGIYQEIGRFHLQNNRVARAEGVFRQIIKRDPSFTPAIISLATIYREQCRFKEARAVLFSSIQKSEDHQKISMELKTIHRLQAIFKKQESLIEKGMALATKHSPKEFETRLEWFRLLIMHGKFSAAFRLAKQTINPDPNFMWELLTPIAQTDAKPPNKIALQYLLRKLKRIKAQSPHALWGYFYQAVISEIIWDHDSPPVLTALDRLRRSMSTRDLWMIAFTAKSRLHRGCWVEAMKDLQVVLRHFPESWKTHCHMGEVQLGLGHTDRAMKEFQKAVACSEDRGSVLAWRGEMHLWIGNYRAALQDLRNALRFGSNLASCWLGASLMKLGQYQKAVEYLNQAIDQRPLDGEAHLWRGEAKGYMGQYPAALADINRAIRLTNAIWGYFNRALIYSMSGKLDKMRTDFNYIVQAFPELVDFVAKRTGVDICSSPNNHNIVKFLKAGLELGRGNRRGERYATLITMATYR